MIFLVRNRLSEDGMLFLLWMMLSASGSDTALRLFFICHEVITFLVGLYLSFTSADHFLWLS